MPAATTIALLAALTSAQAVPLNEDLQILGPWREALRDAQSNDSVVNSAVVGDSITTKRNTWVYWLRNHLWDHFGNAGEGSLDVHSSSTGDDTGGYVCLPIFVDPWGLNGAWSRQYNDSYPGHIFFPTGTWVTCNHEGGGWRMQFIGAEATLRYLEEPGAGTFTVRVGTDVALTVDANGPEKISTTVTVPLPDAGFHVLEFESTAPQANPAPVVLDLLDVRTGQPGSVVHRWGQGGKPCSYFLEKNEQMYQSLFDTVLPDVLWIQCDPAGEDLDVYDQDLRALVARYQNLRPGMPIVLLSHHRFSDGHVAPTLFMYHVAEDDPNVAFINLFDLHAAKVDIVTLGYLQDDVHLSTKGGQFYAAWIVREMLGWSRADLDVDGEVGQTDLGQLLSAYGAAIGDDAFIDLADINRDGVVGQPDLGLLLADYGWTAP
jgi:hypothetical protein